MCPVWAPSLDECGCKYRHVEPKWDSAVRAQVNSCRKSSKRVQCGEPSEIGVSILPVTATRIRHSNSLFILWRTSGWLKITGPNLLAPVISVSALIIKQFGRLFSASLVQYVHAPLSRRLRNELDSRGHHDWPVKPTIRPQAERRDEDQTVSLRIRHAPDR